MICRFRRHAINPNDDVRRHLEEKHRSIDIRTRKPLMAYASGLEVVGPDGIIIPDSSAAALECLELLKGQRCEECGYVCASERSLEEDCRMEHRWVKA